MKVQKLQNEITQNGFTYKLVKSTDSGYLFSIHNSESDTMYGYEVFMRKLTPLCVDFEKKIFSETEFKERYPKANDFGVWAWTAKRLERAEEILESFEKVNVNNRENQSNPKATHQNAD
ncbi:hypothetical protein Q73A0000_01365 [Kaistella flava (ex Peng et al. 2021)]|uniref:Uncharacterized protein n=1 Tax=Kaistella flava (ex Peng et al. 2021) TaxID=2038776 RepID=A0A7M2Y4J0_9FLAO|nr:hypothetical protein [Kaistella flava (ex Peng et al. 2021)]QOW09091.1 hypothetical protein Q73A0000_01365 [Kaistella flava (ex Peng et al. 2021)]